MNESHRPPSDADWAGETERRKILVDNPAELFGF